MTPALPAADETVAQPDTLCLFCGGTEIVAVHEIWGHEFIARRHRSRFITDPVWARQFLRSLDIEGLAGHRLRRLADDGTCGLVLDWQLEIAPVSFHDARCFIARHHAHCAAPAGWRFGAGVWNGGAMIGVVTVGNPVARALCRQRIIEVNRLCIRRDLPAPLCWNAASMLYGWSAREAARRGWHKIITYTREDSQVRRYARRDGYRKRACMAAAGTGRTLAVEL